MRTDPVIDAQKLANSGRATEGAHLLAQAGEAGDAQALYELALWLLYGNRIQRNVPASRAILRRAVAAGATEGALLEVALAATGSGAAPDWTHALALLHTAAADDPVAAQHLSLVEAMSLQPDGTPLASPTVSVIGENPTVQRVTGLLTAAECDHLASVAAPMLSPATVVDPRTGRNVVNPVRTSDTAVLGPHHETLPIHAINRRIAEVSRTDWRQGEALTIMRYRRAQVFRPHIDAIAGAKNQRIATVLVYLNEGFEGGETSFLASGIKVTPRRGDAILFDNVDSGGAIDPLTQHAGEAVRRGEKWLATRWIRSRPFDPWSGGPEAA